ncbi:MAG: hypothetical protein KBE91_12080, partial [Bacteroidia bacterium]|nr:hypothetical protein [Bacteroidia bacterium]
MAHTTATALSGYVAGTFTTCFSSATAVTPVLGWNNYTFTSLFNYNDQDNIVIEICFDNTTWSGNYGVQSSTTLFNSIYGTYMDFGVGCAAGNLQNIAGVSTNRPNMRVNYFPNITGNNIGILSIDSPTTFCSNLQNIYATVVNAGINSVTGFNVNWSVNGTLQTPIASTATLDTIGGANLNKLQVLLGNYNFPSGASTLLKVWTSGPNNQIDTV